MASSVEENKTFLEELSAPPGWKKMIVPKKSTTPGKNAVVFVSPTGEDIKTKTQLVRYLKANPGGPSSSEFDWSTGETPRRSRRISEISKATESPEVESPKKRPRKSISKQVAENEDEGAEEEHAVEEKVDTVAAEETKACEEVEIKETETVPEKIDDESGKKEEEICNEKEKADEKIVSSTAHDEKVENEAPSNADDDSKEEKKQDEPQGDDLKEEKKLDEPQVDEANSIDKEVPAQQLPGENYPMGLEEKTVHEPKTSEISC